MAATMAAGFADGRGEVTEGEEGVAGEEAIAEDAPGASAYVTPEE
jgi:hypothetical protein